MANGQAPSGQGPSAAELMQNVGAGLQQLTQALTQSQEVPPEIKEQMTQVMQGYMSVVQALQGGGGGQQQQQQSGPVPQEAPTGGQPVTPANRV